MSKTHQPIKKMSRKNPSCNRLDLHFGDIYIIRKERSLQREELDDAVDALGSIIRKENPHISDQDLAETEIEAIEVYWVQFYTRDQLREKIEALKKD